MSLLLARSIGYSDECMAQVFLNRFRQHIFIAFLVIGIVVLYGVSFLPYFINAKNAPPEVSYLWTTEYPIDVYGNLSSINDGIHGSVARISKITTGIPALNAPFIKFEYVGVGLMAGLFGFTDTFSIFYAYRTLLSALAVIVSYLFIRSFFRIQWLVILGLFFCFFSAGITRLGAPKQIWDMMFGDGMVFGRLTTAMPHYLLGIIGSLLFLIVFDRYAKPQKVSIQDVVLIGLLTAASTLINVTSIVIPFLSTGAITFFMVITKRFSIRKGIVWLCVTGILFLLPSLYLMYVGKFWDFSMFAKTEKLWSIPFTPALYFDAVGLVYALSFLSIPGIVKRRRAGEWAMLLWLVIHPFMVFFGSDLLHFNSARMFFVPQYVIFSVLATMGLSDLFYLVKRYSRIGAYALVGLAIGAVVWSSWGTYHLYYRKSLVQFGPNRWPYPYGAPKKTVYEALLWLRDNTKGETVLSGYHSGTMIPGIAGNFVYTSWWLYLSQDPRLGEILKPHLAFWYREMTDGQAQEFLKKNGIRYIFFGPEEKGVPRIVNPGVYPFLTRVFTNGDVEIFEYPPSSFDKLRTTEGRSE